MADQAIGIGRGTRERHGRQWLRVFVVGLLLWAASVVVTFATGNTNLVPTVILLGSFRAGHLRGLRLERHADRS